jgi:hypothetical protein
MTDDELTKVKVEAFVGGVKAASIAMRAVLALKVDVGVITEATALAIFEGIGKKLDEVFAELSAEKP